MTTRQTTATGAASPPGDDDALYVGPTEEPNRYRLGNPVGKGGQGQVYEAWLRLEEGPKKVALKLLSRRDQDANFDACVVEARRELAIVQAIEHSAIVRMKEVFVGAPPHRASNSSKSGECLYLVMNWVDGMTLSTWVIANPNRSWADVARVMHSLSAGVAHLHSGSDTAKQPICHRDLKPANVIIGDEGQIRLVDFGLARSVARLPAPGYTPGYGAPETRSGRFSIASDIYSLSGTAYYMLVGEDPPEEHDPVALRAGLGRSPFLVDRPAVLEHLLRGLDAEPERRPASVEDWLKGFGSSRPTVPGSSSRLAPPAPVPPTPPPSPRPSRPWWKLSVAVLVIALLGVLLVRAIRDVGGGGTSVTTTSPAQPGVTSSPFTRAPASDHGGIAADSSLAPVDQYQDVQHLVYVHLDRGYEQPDPRHVLIVHGDLRPSSTLRCEVRVFRPGETVQGLGERDATISRVLATEAQIEYGIQRAMSESYPEEQANVP